MMKEQLRSTFKELLTLHAISGSEEILLPYIEEKVKPYLDDVYYDNFGNLIANKKGNGKKLLICAHADEIGFLVRNITKDGFLLFAKVGGTPDKIMQARKVIVDGKLNGIIGIRPGHLHTPEERTKIYQAKECYIDIGASSKEEALAMGVNIGSTAVFESDYMELNNSDLICSRAVDDRIGCAILIELIKEIAAKPVDYDVYFVFGKQEEVGLKGARAVGNTINPDIAIALDTTLSGDTPDVNFENEVPLALGAGAVCLLSEGATRGGFMDRRVRTLIEEAAANCNEKLQYASFLGYSLATDANELSVSGIGAAAGTIAIPRRYSHTPVELMNINDAVSAYNILLSMISLM